MKQPVGGRKRIFSLPVSAWPVAHRQRWQAAVDPGTVHDPFGEFTGGAGALTEFSEERRNGIAESWGMILKLAEDENPEPTIDSHLIRKFVSGLKSRRVRPRTIHSYLTRIHEGAKVLLPDKNHRWIREEANRFFAESKRQPKRKDGRVVSGEKLLGLGLILCDEARRRHSALGSTALLFRDGVMIALLSLAPARISNFASIEIGHHLDLTSNPGHLVWSASETKQRREQSHRLPPEVRDLLVEYIYNYRKTLLDGYGGDRLWLTEHGGRPLTQGAIRKQIKRHTLERLGIDVTPHFFRDSVAVTVSERAPDEMEITTLVLRHGSEESTRPYRDQATTISAANIAQEEIEADRQVQLRKVRAANARHVANDEDEVFRRFV